MQAEHRFRLPFRSAILGSGIPDRMHPSLPSVRGMAGGGRMGRLRHAVFSRIAPGAPKPFAIAAARLYHRWKGLTPKTPSAMPDILRAIPENPVPEGAVGGMMTAADGRRIRYARFPSRGEHGTAVLLPGRNECIEKYFETVCDLASRGFAAASLDWRGQGGSERLLKDPRRGHVRSFAHYVA